MANIILNIRSFYHIQADLQHLFRYVEPAAENLNTYSYEIQQLLIRTCVEIEANFKAIFSQSQFTLKAEHNWNMTDYSRVNVSHHLSGYRVQYPLWDDPDYQYCPFEAWAGNRTTCPAWYDAYNRVKHDKSALNQYATLKHLLDAFLALLVLLMAEYGGRDHIFGDKWLGIGNYLTLHTPEEPVHTETPFDYNKLMAVNGVWQ